MKKVLAITVLLTLALAVAAWAVPVEKPIPNVLFKNDPSVAVQGASRLDLLTESFELGVPPTGWSIMTTGNAATWLQAGAGNTGAFSAAVPYGDIGLWQDEWLVTPAVDASTVSVLFLEFFENQDYWADWGLEHDIMVSTTVPDDPNAFVSVLNMTPANHVIDGWTANTVDLSAYAGSSTLYVAFRYQGDYADNWYVDDVRLFEPPEHDVALKGLTPVDAIEYPGASITPQITVENKGQNVETFDVNLVVSYNGGPLSDETITVTDLPVGGTMVVNFAPFTTVLGDYVLSGETQLVGDLVPGNDTGAGMVTCWGVPRTPLMALYTEWGCAPCVGANQALDAYYPTLGNDAALLRVHVSWPSGTDPMYWANVDENEYLLGMTPFPVSGVPNPVMDNLLDVWTLSFTTWEEGIQMAYAESAALPSPLTVDLNYNMDTGNAEVFVEVINELAPTSTYRLFVAVTEDNVANPGPNGEAIHNQCFRQIFPSVMGMSVNADPGLSVHEVPLVLDPNWDFQSLRAVAYVQDYPGGTILNCGTIFLHEGIVSNDDIGIGDDVPDGNPVMLTQVKGAYPNPFNPMVTIEFSVARPQHVTLSVFNIHGQHVKTLVNGTIETGDHPVMWNGTDEAGRGVSSGTYFVQMQSEDRVSSSKIMLVR